jgi:hypothetical protein
VGDDEEHDGENDVYESDCVAHLRQHRTSPSSKGTVWKEEKRENALFANSGVKILSTTSAAARFPTLRSPSSVSTSFSRTPDTSERREKRKTHPLPSAGTLLFVQQQSVRHGEIGRKVTHHQTSSPSPSTPSSCQCRLRPSCFVGVLLGPPHQHPLTLLRKGK